MYHSTLGLRVIKKKKLGFRGILRLLELCRGAERTLRAEHRDVAALQLDLRELRGRQLVRELRGRQLAFGGCIDRGPACVGSSCLRRVDSCITQLKAQGPSRTCDESKEEEEDAPALLSKKHADLLLLLFFFSLVSGPRRP